MDNVIQKLISYNIQKTNNDTNYTVKDALNELDELKNIALNSLDKNGNPNVSAALRAIEAKAKIAGLYKQNLAPTQNVVQMSEIIVDGEQLKLNIGEEFF